MLQFLSGIFSNRPRRAIRPSNGGSLFRQPFSFKRRMDARYDAAVMSDDNRKHWSADDGLSAKSANGASIRRTLRNRARYEIANNSYARGISLTLANDIVGTGPWIVLVLDLHGLDLYFDDRSKERIASIQLPSSTGYSIVKSDGLVLAFSSPTAVALANGGLERTMVRKGDTECEYFSPVVLAKLDGTLLLT